MNDNGILLCYRHSSNSLLELCSSSSRDYALCFRLCLYRRSTQTKFGWLSVTIEHFASNVEYVNAFDCYHFSYKFLDFFMEYSVHITYPLSLTCVRVRATIQSSLNSNEFKACGAISNFELDTVIKWLAFVSNGFYVSWNDNDGPVYYCVSDIQNIFIPKIPICTEFVRKCKYLESKSKVGSQFRNSQDLFSTAQIVVPSLKGQKLRFGFDSNQIRILSASSL